MILLNEKAPLFSQVTVSYTENKEQEQVAEEQEQKVRVNLSLGKDLIKYQAMFLELEADYMVWSKIFREEADRISTELNNKIDKFRFRSNLAVLALIIPIMGVAYCVFEGIQGIFNPLHITPSIFFLIYFMVASINNHVKSKNIKYYRSYDSWAPRKTPDEQLLKWSAYCLAASANLSGYRRILCEKSDLINAQTYLSKMSMFEFSKNVAELESFKLDFSKFSSYRDKIMAEISCQQGANLLSTISNEEMKKFDELEERLEAEAKVER